MRFSKYYLGKISYMAKSSGPHYVCILCPSNNWFKDTSVKWKLSIEAGGIDIDLNDAAKKSELSKTISALQSLKKKFSSMKSQQAHQKLIVRFALLFCFSMCSGVIYFSFFVLYHMKI